MFFVTDWKPHHKKKKVDITDNYIFQVSNSFLSQTRSRDWPHVIYKIFIAAKQRADSNLRVKNIFIIAVCEIYETFWR